MVLTIGRNTIHYMAHVIESILDFHTNKGLLECFPWAFAIRHSVSIFHEYELLLTLYPVNCSQDDEIGRGCQA